jgi:hypothetical protein
MPDFIPSHVLNVLDSVRKQYEDYARKFSPDSEYGMLSREAMAIIWKELAPSERAEFIEGYIHWQKSAAKPILAADAERNAYEMIEWARPEYDDNAKPLSDITTLSLSKLKERALGGAHHA